MLMNKFDLTDFSEEIQSIQDELTPVEERAGVLVKRDDLYSAHGASGGKARACLSYVMEAAALGVPVVTAGSKSSPQIQIAAKISHALGVPFHAHCPSGKIPAILEEAQSFGAILHQHIAGYNAVLCRRAMDNARDIGAVYIPFGMEGRVSVVNTAAQVRSLVGIQAKRLVVPIGSGMSTAGILHGMRVFGIDIPVLGVSVGASPERRLAVYAPGSFQSGFRIVRSRHDYHTEIHSEIDGLKLDPIYEAKCAEYLRPGDIFWIVGNRHNKGDAE